MEITPRYLVMVTPDNHNKFYHMTPEGASFTVTYGRVGQSQQTTSYPISQYEKKYKEKIKKGYRDVSDLRQDLVTEQPTGEAAYKPVDIPSVQEVLEYLMSVSRDAVFKNYTVTSASVTQAMVDEAQKTLDELTAADTMERFNEILLRLFAVIPRRMGQVSPYLAKSQTDFTDIILREQNTLDTMAGQVFVKAAVQSENHSEITIPESMGIEIRETTPEEVRIILAAMNESNSHYSRSWAVTNYRTQENYDQYIHEHNIETTKLLFHGSRNENWISILSKGLMIRPSNAVFTGNAFGNGIYFAPKCQKSIGYTSLSGSYWAKGKSNKAYMALYETAYGNPYYLYDYSSETARMSEEYLLNKTPACNCLHAKADKGMLRNDEIIFYTPRQMTVRYLIEIE
ncbi:MAG: WGR domain-containing protein [Clostridia bacterium]|nr:WGR domain-containing protein [Clostridia bacterium]